MRYIFNLVPVCMAFVLLSSCVEEEQALEQPEVRLVSVTGTTVAEDGSGAEVNFEAAGGSVDVEVSANCDWTVESGLGYWYAIEILDDSSFRITASDNQEGGVRYANVSVAASNGAGVSSASVVLRQAAPGQESAIPIEYTLQGEDTDVIIPGQGGTYRIEVSCAENWTAISLSNWIAVEQDAAGFTITAGENSTIGIITIFICAFMRQSFTVSSFPAVAFRILLLGFLATIAEQNIVFIILFNFIVPFCVVFLLSDDFVPRNYFIYGFTYVLLQAYNIPISNIHLRMEAILTALLVSFIFLVLNKFLTKHKVSNNLASSSIKIISKKLLSLYNKLFRSVSFCTFFSIKKAVPLL